MYLVGLLVGIYYWDQNRNLRRDINERDDRIRQEAARVNDLSHQMNQKDTHINQLNNRIFQSDTINIQLVVVSVLITCVLMWTLAQQYPRPVMTIINRARQLRRRANVLMEDNVEN